MEVKAEINWVILTSYSTYKVLQKLLLGGAKDGHFSFSQRSCKIGLTAKLIFLPCNFTNVCTILLPPLFAIEQRRKVKIPRRTSVLANCTYDVHLLIGRASCNTVEYFEFFTPKVKSFTYLISTFCFLGSPNNVTIILPLERDHSSIMSAKRWVGGSENGNCC